MRHLEVVKEQKGYPYSKHINFNATNRIQDLIGRKYVRYFIQGGYSSEIFTEETGKDYASPAPVLLGLLKHGWPPLECFIRCDGMKIAFLYVVLRDAAG